MAKAAKKQVEAEEPAPPSCLRCCHASMQDVNGFMRCGASLPPFVKRSDRPQDYLVRADSVCVLFKQWDFL
jgi:hypothetical protein